MCVSYFVQYKKEHAVKAGVLLAQGQKKNQKKKKKNHQVQRENGLGHYSNNIII